MLTRLKVTGFKNLVDVDLRFGPLTCITGASGTGKSNLIDAITFLGSLADLSLIDAARSVRGEGGRVLDIHNLFHRAGDNIAAEMSFEAEMIIPERGVDDLGQEVKAKITFLRYRVTIGFRRGDPTGFDGIELRHEELSHISLGTAPQNLLFPHKVTAWRHSAVKGRRSGGAFISTQGQGKGRIIELHTDGEGGGRPHLILAENLTRAILSTVNTAEYPTALLARREMQSWRHLRLEPSALRRSDELTAQTRLGKDGSNLAATIYNLAKFANYSEDISLGTDPAEPAESGLYVRLARLLNEFGIAVLDIRVVHEEKRELLSLMLTGHDGTSFSARSLSDGALRFLGLAVITLDTQTPTLICLEEPENGICPDRIPAIMNLLHETAVDVYRPVGPDNPLRQVIITTYSPVVLSLIPEECLLVAEISGLDKSGRQITASRFSCLPDTWRDNPDENTFTIERDRVFSSPDSKPQHAPEHHPDKQKKEFRTRPRSDEECQQVQPSLPYGE